MARQVSDITIYCIGSPFGADQLGQQIARQLNDEDFSHAIPRHRVTVEYLDRPGAALVDYLHDKHCVVLIDALQSEEALGLVRWLELDELAYGEGLSSHGLGVADALALARSLGQLPDKLLIMGVVASDLETAAAEHVYEQVRRALFKRLSAC